MTAGPATPPHRAARLRTSPLWPFERFTGASAVGWVIVAAMASCLGVLLLTVRGRWGLAQRVDDGATDALRRVAASAPADTVLTAVTDLGGNPVLWWLVTVIALGLVIRGRAALAGYLVVTGLGALALIPAVELLVGWFRPGVPGSTAAGLGDGVPSGHAFNATVFFGALLLVFLPVVAPRARGWVVGALVAVVAVVGLSRPALTTQPLSEVLAGWLVGLAWLAVTGYAYRRWVAGDASAATAAGWRRLADGLEPAAAPALATPSAPDRPQWREVAVLPLYWLLVGGFLVGFGTLVTWRAPGFDEGIPRWLASQRTPPLSEVSLFWSHLGGTRWIMIVALVIIPLAIAYVRRWRPAVFVAVVMFGELGLFLASAASVGRARPLVSQMDGYLPTSSFPSGHVAATTCLYVALAVLVVPRTRGWLRWLAIVVAVVMPAMVALSRMYRGEHHPLDVTGGILLALLWVFAVRLVLRPNADLSDPVPPIAGGRADAPQPAPQSSPQSASRPA